jgi:hypothetical protein
MNLDDVILVSVDDHVVITGASLGLPWAVEPPPRG